MKYDLPAPVIVEAYAKQYEITKLRGIIPAGETGVLFVKSGIETFNCDDNDIIVLQESTRPLITEEIISKLLYTCKSSAVVCEPMDDYVQFLKQATGRNMWIVHVCFRFNLPRHINSE